MTAKTERGLRGYYDAHPSYGSVAPETVTDGLKALAPGLEPRSVLDLGCGDGRLVDVFPEATIVGVDYSWQRVALARRRARGVFINYPIDEFLRRSGTLQFDLVTLCEVLEHLEDPAVIVEMARVHGPVLATVPINWPDPAHLQVWPTDLEMEQALRPDRFIRNDRDHRWVCLWEGEAR